MTYEWVDCDCDFIGRRYDRLAAIIPLFDWLFFLPRGLRKQAVGRLRLKHGQCVLEVGCGTGRNFSFLREATGPTGRIYGVDLSAGMLRRARRLTERHHWTNIYLTEGDAANYVAPEPLDGVLFSLSYNTMPHHLTVLHRVWKQLRPGGRLVIMDAKVPPGLGGELLLPISLWVMRQTLLGNPCIRPWEHHAELVDNFEMEEFLFASYYVCCGIKPGDPCTLLVHPHDHCTAGSERQRVHSCPVPNLALRQRTKAGQYRYGRASGCKRSTFSTTKRHVDPLSRGIDIIAILSRLRFQSAARCCLTHAVTCTSIKSA